MARAQAADLRALAGNTAPIPVPETAEDIDFDGGDGKLEFNSASSVQDLAGFFRATLKPLGWKEQPTVINRANMVALDFTKAGKEISLTIMQLGPKANVSADGSGLVAAGGANAPDTAQSANPPTQASAEDLEPEESGGLPVPKRHTMSEGDQSPFRQGLTASVPLDLATVLAFYRGELGKRGWKEETQGSVVKADQVTLSFTSAEGPGVLKLGRKDSETTVSLALRKPAEAAKAGILPNAGQAKVLLGNALGAEAAITINKQTIKVPAGAGAKGPNGPSLELPPGKYAFSFKIAGRPAQNDEVEVGADEVWGLLIGPGGALALHLY